MVLSYFAKTVLILTILQSAMAETLTPIQPPHTTLPNLGDGVTITPAAERRLGDRIARELYRDPDYLDDAVIGDYVQGIWLPLMAAARARGELPPELDTQYAWRLLLGRDRSVNAFALPGAYFLSLIHI